MDRLTGPVLDGKGAGSAGAPPMIRAGGLVKIFGSDADEAMRLRRDGRSKQEVLTRTGCSVAVDDVSFSIERGELFVIMGLSGSGKSTLIRLVNRLVEPTAGTVEIDGRDMASLDAAELRDMRNRRVNMVFQHFAIFPHRTVRENAGYGLHVRHAPADERRRQVEWALEMVGLEDWGDAYPGELSGGMKQRVGLARALATGAEVMLMDEPFSALDPLIRRGMQDLIVRLHKELQRTIVFVTHDLNEAMRIGDRIMLMRDGRVRQIGTPSDILNRPVDEHVAEFVADVDRTRVLTARDVMRQPARVASPAEPAADVLAWLESAGLRGVYVVDAGRIVGVAPADSLRRAGAGPVEHAATESSFATTALDTPLLELCDRVGGSSVPLAVVDDDGRLAGVVPRRAVLDGIARSRKEGVHA